jgi:hypothetical protein
MAPKNGWPVNYFWGPLFGHVMKSGVFSTPASLRMHLRRKPEEVHAIEAKFIEALDIHVTEIERARTHF